MLALCLVLASATASCSKPPDPATEEFCDRFVTAVRANLQLVEPGATGADGVTAADASGGLFEGPAPEEIEPEMDVVRQYLLENSGTYSLDEFLESYQVVRAYGIDMCDELTEAERDRLRAVTYP